MNTPAITESSSNLQQSPIEHRQPAISHGLVDEKALYSDSTHLKANANKGKFTYKEITQSTKSHVAELDRAVDVLSYYYPFSRFNCYVGQSLVGVTS